MEREAIAGNPPKVRASFAKGRCVRGPYVPSDRAQEITKSRSFTRPSRVLARFSIGGGNPKVADTDNLVLRGFSFKIGDDDYRSNILVESAPVHFARRLDQMLAFLKARIPGPNGKRDMKSQAILRRQSRNAASGKLHRRASAAREFCRHDLLGSTLLSRNEFKRRDSVHQVQGRSGRRRHHADRGLGQSEICRLPARRPRKSDRFGRVRFNVMALLDRPGDPVMDVTLRGWRWL
jgi:catalase